MQLFFDKSGNTGVEIGENTINENAPIIVDDSTYGIYFNEDGTIKDDSPIVLGSTILIGELSDKKLVIEAQTELKKLEKMLKEIEDKEKKLNKGK